MSRSLCLAIASVAGLLAVVAVPIARADTITVCRQGSGDYLTIQEDIDYEGSKTGK